MKNLDCSNCFVQHKSCFNTLSQEDLLWINETKISTFYKKGQIIFHEGRIPSGIYCIKSGAVKISKNGLDGKEQIVRFVVPGELLGIRAYIAQRNYKASATALDDTVVCYINRSTFDQILIKYPFVSKCLTLSLTKLLEDAENKLTSLAQKPVRERVAETLIVLNKIFMEENCHYEKGTINLSREDLANIVGTATETVIRILSEFKEEHLIVMNGRKIILHDIDNLKKIARNEL
jgi:CRP-like cAMP-binding protein